MAKEAGSALVLATVDEAAVLLSVVAAFATRAGLSDWLGPQTVPLKAYFGLVPLWWLPLLILAYEGVYTRRYDFWQEARLVLKSLFLSAVLLLAYLALSKNVDAYSRPVIVFSFVWMGLLIPLFKWVAKHLLYRAGLWRKRAFVEGHGPLEPHAVLGDPYLGYVPAPESESETLFVQSAGLPADELRRMIDRALGEKREVLFVPLLNEFDLTRAAVYGHLASRSNLIQLNNRLKNGLNRRIKRLFEMVITLGLAPIILPLMGWIAWRIHRESPNDPVLFTQQRLGEKGRIFACYKFRTMHPNADALLAEYLADHPEEIDHFERYHKYRNDPRITHTGRLLRRLSLDELPQIYNVLKGEMSLVGPRPYLPEEASKLGDAAPMVLSVRPGMTGLWQVSGRNLLDFKTRVAIDVWYIRNWNLWLDMVILLKTVKTVILREGAR
jgi:undecaprenyl-phosphate galactose phosphotransferase